MPGSRSGLRAAQRAFDQACTLYEELATTLTSVLMGLRAEQSARALEKEELEAIRSFQKTVLMVLDFETKLLKQRVQVKRDAQRDGASGLDLAAARREVERRLDRLAAAQRADGVPEQPKP